MLSVSLSHTLEAFVPYGYVVILSNVWSLLLSLLFSAILFTSSDNHTKIHTLMFCLYLILTFLSMQAYSFLLLPHFYFNHASWLNLITLCTVFNFNPLFNACFNALTWMAYFSLSSILQTSSYTFSNFLLSGENGKSLWDPRNVYRYSISN